MSGKWHVCGDVTNPNDAWPCHRGFDRFYGILGGGASYFWPETLTRDNTNVEYEAQNDPDFYLTDAISDSASEFIAAHSGNIVMGRSSSTLRIHLPTGRFTPKKRTSPGTGAGSIRAGMLFGPSDWSVCGRWA